MEFAKYYDVTEIMNKLIEQGKLFSYTKDFCKKLYICSDIHDFWISRVQEGYNSEYEQQDGKWLIERNKIDKYAFIDFIGEKNKKEYNVDSRSQRDFIINRFSANKVIEYLILMDDDNGLENWDICECNSFEEVEEVIDGGFGIIRSIV